VRHKVTCTDDFSFRSSGYLRSSSLKDEDNKAGAIRITDKICYDPDLFKNNLKLSQTIAHATGILLAESGLQRTL